MVSEKAMSYTAAHSNIWREYVAKDCSICKRPVPFERIRRHPRALTWGRTPSTRWTVRPPTTATRPARPSTTRPSTGRTPWTAPTA